MKMHHCEIINQMTELLISVLKNAATESKNVVRNSKVENKFVHGWNEVVKFYYEDYRDSFLNWRASARNDEVRFRVMCGKRKVLRKALCRCRRENKSVKVTN